MPWKHALVIDILDLKMALMSLETRSTVVIRIGICCVDCTELMFLIMHVCSQRLSTFIVCTVTGLIWNINA
jgi:hypothetical protein